MKYEIIIIGGGTAGLRTAIMCSRKTKVLMVEPGVIGGTCLNTGCIPTKAMIYASHLYDLGKNMSFFGIEAKPKVNFEKVMDRVNSISAEGRKHINQGLKKNKNLDVVKGKAKFIGKKKIQVGSKVYEGENIVIATGAKNFVPPIKGLKETGFHDNETMLKAKKLPKSVIMIGGGYISMEYASFFNNFDVKVTVLERLPEVLEMLDDDIRDTLVTSNQKQDITIKTNINILEVKSSGKNVEVIYNDVRDPNSKKESVKAESVFLATGRVPNTKSLEAEKSGIKVGKRGDIMINSYLETSCKGVYAIGDCNGKPMFAHSAKRQTDIVKQNIF
jgi:pyruvate/2-oxoglutarate dehydrogenase complex dihydrolipoamide dehydrogenase (E3) component